MADFGGELDAFRTEVRDWLKANYPPQLEGAGELEPGRHLGRPQVRELATTRRSPGCASVAGQGLDRAHLAREIRRRRTDA